MDQMRQATNGKKGRGQAAKDPHDMHSQHECGGEYSKFRVIGPPRSIVIAKQYLR
jgi:hypothetical protein